MNKILRLNEKDTKHPKLTRRTPSAPKQLDFPAQTLSPATTTALLSNPNQENGGGFLKLTFHFRQSTMAVVSSSPS